MAITNGWGLVSDETMAGRIRAELRLMCGCESEGWCKMHGTASEQIRDKRRAAR